MPARPADLLQSRVFGLTADLREPSSTTTSGPALDDTNRMARMLGVHRPNFSVEIFSTSFDHRGYPVYSGRGTSVRGVVRMPATEGCDVMMTLSAHTTSGSPAAVWQGTALAPWSTGGEKKVFEIKDRLVANYDLVRPRAAYAPKNEDLMEPPQISKDDLVLPIPFDVQLPLGKATRFIDGEMQAVPVALPPSFEISSKFAAQEKREIRLATKGKAKGPMAKELIEKVSKRSTASAATTRSAGRSSAPTMPTSRASRPASRRSPPKATRSRCPSSSSASPRRCSRIRPPSLDHQPRRVCGARHDAGRSVVIHKSQAKWSGSLLKSSKKTVDMELHIPNPPVLQAPSVLPIMLVLRPTEPTLLSQIRTRAPSETSTAPGSPAVTQTDDPIEMVASPVLSSGESTAAPSMSSQQTMRDADTESIRTTRSLVSKLMKPSMTLSRLPGSSSRKGGSSIFGGRRPNTAPSSGSSDTGLTDAMTDRTYVAAGAIPDLVSLVCISLIQTTFSSNDNVNDGPEQRRKLLSVADLEEVDVHALLLSSDSSGSQPGSRPGSSRSPDEMAQINAAAAAAKAAGVRVLVGSLKVAGTTPPTLPLPRPRGQVCAQGGSAAGETVQQRRGRGEGAAQPRAWAAAAAAASRTARARRRRSTRRRSLRRCRATAAAPPTTPPNMMSPSLFGSRSPGMDGHGPSARAWTRQTGSRNASRWVPARAAATCRTSAWPSRPTDESAVSADTPEAQELLSPQLEAAAARAPMVAAPYPSAFPQHASQHASQHAAGRATPSVYGSQMSSAASVRTGWGSGHSISEASQMQSSIYMSEWGRDRKTVSKINKTIGEMWLDVRVVRAHNAY